MYAVVNSGGKQYKVRQGEVLRVEKISGDVGNPVTFDRVLMFSDGENVSIGQPTLEDIAVEGRIVEQGKAKKIIVFKYKKRKRYRRKKGHRQEFTAVFIDSIKPKAEKSSETGDEPKAEVKKPVTEKAAPKEEEAKKAAPNKETLEKSEPETATAEEAEAEKETQPGQAGIE
jgi:large subunit ribosomal protein L21